MAISTSARIDEIDAAISALLDAMTDTSGVEEYQLPSGVRVRRANFGTTVSRLQEIRDRLARSVSSRTGRVRVGSLGLTGGIDR